MSGVLTLAHLDVAPGMTTTVLASLTPDAGSWALTKIRLNGQPGVRVMLAWDWGGANQKVITATEGDIDYTLDTSLALWQLSTSGWESLSLVVQSSIVLTSGYVGGSVELVSI